MRIIITVPKDDLEVYLEEVTRQIHEGFTSGHVDRDTHWDSEDN